MDIKKIEKFAEGPIEFFTKWNGFDVYSPKPEGYPPVPIGMVLYLVKGEEIRLASNDEFFAILDTLPD